MRLLKRTRDSAGRAEAAEDPHELLASLHALSQENRMGPDHESERRLVALRHRAGVALMRSASGTPRFADPHPAALPARALPDLAPSELTAGLLRAAILRDGCAMVRGLLPRAEATRLAGLIDQAFSERARAEAGVASGDGLYEPEPHFDGHLRPWIKEGGGLLAADSPPVCAAMIDAFSAAGVPALVSDYLGEPALLSIHKTTLRKADPSVSGAWHQDGFFMGPVRSLNLWLSLSRCGDESPGLDILPRRLERYLATGTEGAELTWTISEDEVRTAGAEVTRPIFEPGDALFFDELFLHKTGSDPAMPRPRFAIESWFFGASGFPAEYEPLAL